MFASNATRKFRIPQIRAAQTTCLVRVAMSLSRVAELFGRPFWPKPTSKPQRQSCARSKSREHKGRKQTDCRDKIESEKLSLSKLQNLIR